MSSSNIWLCYNSRSFQGPLAESVARVRFSSIYQINLKPHRIFRLVPLFPPPLIWGLFTAASRGLCIYRKDTEYGNQPPKFRGSSQTIVLLRRCSQLRRATTAEQGWASDRGTWRTISFNRLSNKGPWKKFKNWAPRASLVAQGYKSPWNAKGHQFDSWSGKIYRLEATESVRATTTEACVCSSQARAPQQDKAPQKRAQVLQLE